MAIFNSYDSYVCFQLYVNQHVLKKRSVRTENCASGRNFHYPASHQHLTCSFGGPVKPGVSLTKDGPRMGTDCCHMGGQDCGIPTQIKENMFNIV